MQDEFERFLKAKPKEKEETFHYSAPDYNKLPYKEKLAKLTELLNTAKNLTKISTMDKTLRDRYASKALAYERMIQEVKAGFNG